MKLRKFFEEITTTDVEGYDTPVDQEETKGIHASYNDEQGLKQIQREVEKYVGRGVSLTVTSSKEAIIQGPGHVLGEIKEKLSSYKKIEVK